MKNKLMTPEEAVRKFIKDGFQIALGGFTINRNPMGIVYEIIRQGIKDLLAVADPRVMSGTALNSGLIEAFSIVGHRKLHTLAFLGAAQTDRFGNINSTCIGDYRKPRVRFPGSGGACDAASLASGVIIFMQHDRRKFVQKVDYLTSPGCLEGRDSRKKAGLSRGGPIAVVSNLGVMKFHEKTKEMYLAEYYPGVTVDHIVEHTGFEMDVSKAVESEPPSLEELRILREEGDPQRLILG